MFKIFLQRFFLRRQRKTGFTLIEMLMVMGIVAVLGTVTALVLDPIGHLETVRDANRLTDLGSLHKALSLYKIDNPSLFFGSSSVVYLSLPDADTNCANWDLPPLADGWTYSCKTEANYKKIDGAGWIPINLQVSTFGQGLSVLPVDKQNNADNYFYYVYDNTSGTYELGTPLEAEKNQHLAVNDGGDNTAFYEVGTGLALYPMGSSYLAVRNESDVLVYNENNFLMYAQAASVGQAAFFIGSNKITGDNDFFWNNSTKRLGIGTAGPDYKLDVQGGQINSSGGLCIAGDCKTAWSQVQGTNYWTLSSSSLYPNLTTYNLGVGAASLDANYKITTAGGGLKAESTTQPAGYFNSTSGYGLIVNSGNVGIGITTPAALLDVQGAAQFGTGNVNLIDATGKIAGISSTYFASLDGSNLTGLNAANLGSGTVPSARVSGSYTGITGVGTLTAGTWNAATIGTSYGGTGSTAAANTANGVVILNGSTQLPAVSGALLTNLPAPNLRTYDSGWFSVTTNTSYTKTHNLGTQALLIQVYFATDASGSNMELVGDTTHSSSGSYTFGMQVKSITTTSLTILTGAGTLNSSTYTGWWYWGGTLPTGYTSGYYRVIVLAF